MSFTERQQKVCTAMFGKPILTEEDFNQAIDQSLETLFPYGYESGGQLGVEGSTDFAMQTKGFLKPTNWNTDMAKYIVSVKGDWTNNLEIIPLDSFSESVMKDVWSGVSHSALKGLYCQVANKDEKMEVRFITLEQLTDGDPISLGWFVFYACKEGYKG